MNILKWFAPHRAQANCDHRYCYRDIHCTKCGKAYEGSGEPEYTPHIIRNDKPVPAHDENGVLVPDDLEAFIMRNFVNADAPIRCPYCGGDKFIEGPSGGMSINILCANKECRHWFNYHGGIMSMDDLKRVEPTEAEKEAEKRDHEQKKREDQAERFNSGMERYRQGSSAISMLVNPNYARGADAENVERLLGFIDAMCDDIRTLKEWREEIERLRSYPIKQRSVREPVHPAYGPGSITDAASYAPEAFAEAAPEVTSGDDEYRRGMQKMRDMVNEFRAPILLQFFAEFCKFMDGQPGHPCDVFMAWMKERGTPLSPHDEQRFNEAYNKE